MRKITQEACRAFMSNQNYKSSNTRVICDTDNEVSMYLHDNLIAKIENDALYITNAGWSTNTTKERLNGLYGVSINQKNFQWYLNGKQWDGSMIKVVNKYQ